VTPTLSHFIQRYPRTYTKIELKYWCCETTGTWVLEYPLVHV
jgi:hypothetical protein